MASVGFGSVSNGSKKNLSQAVNIMISKNLIREKIKKISTIKHYYYNVKDYIREIIEYRGMFGSWILNKFKEENINKHIKKKLINDAIYRPLRILELIKEIHNIEAENFSSIYNLHDYNEPTNHIREYIKFKNYKACKFLRKEQNILYNNYDVSHQKIDGLLKMFIYMLIDRLIKIHNGKETKNEFLNYMYVNLLPVLEEYLINENKQNELLNNYNIFTTFCFDFINYINENKICFQFRSTNYFYELLNFNVNEKYYIYGRKDISKEFNIIEEISEKINDMYTDYNFYMSFRLDTSQRKEKINDLLLHMGGSPDLFDRYEINLTPKDKKNLVVRHLADKMNF
jgi:hypothetical protein